MSLLSRFLGLGTSGPARDEPETVRRIARQLERLEPARARFLAAFAYILARVAHSDMQIDDAEVVEMKRRLREQADLTPDEAAIVVDIAVAQADDVGGTDDYLVTREFRRMADREARTKLMRSLYAVAASDESITSAETREILAIGEELGLTRAEITSLRLEWRHKLAELQQSESEKRASRGGVTPQK